MVFPNFKRNILNISATIADYLGVPNEHAKLKSLQNELSKDYKNIIFICFDGLSNYTLKKNLKPNDFLRKHISQTVTSTFPSTTTCATTTLMTAQFPSEHGWFGWSLYFDKLDKVVSIFRDCDHYTKEPVETDYAYKVLPYISYFNKTESKYAETTVFYSKCKIVNVAKNHYPFDTLQEQFAIIDNVAKQEGKQFVYCYNHNPDALMHRDGINGKPAHEFIESVNRHVQKFSKEHPDTLLIITADHGHTEITEHINVYEDTALMPFLHCQPYGDARAMSLKVKPDQHRDLLLYNRKKIRQKG